MRLLVVEDAPKMSSLLQRAFREDGYAVDVQASGHDAVWMGCECDFDAVILDIGLPDIDGFDVCRQLRERGRRMPILMLTAREAVPDLVHGLDAGADDYLVKPFAFEELVARLEAVLRRPGRWLGSSLRVGNLVFDTEARQAFIDEQPQALSAREVAVLELLMRRHGRVVTKKLVEDQLFGLSGEVASNAVEVYVHRLRKQLAEHGAKVQIHTMRGLGYLITEDK